MSKIVQFTPHELKGIKKIAQSRREFKEQSAVESQKLDTFKSDEEVDLLGVKGEAAVAKILGPGVKLDREISKSGDDGYDLVCQGATIDVKTSKYTSAKFGMYGRDKQLAADLGVLCWRKSDSSIVIGYWISNPEWQAKHQLRSFKKGRKHNAVTQNEMNPIESLLQ